MRFRCGACRAASLLRTSGSGQDLRASCVSCGRRYRVRDPAVLGATDEERLRSAEELAGAAGLDLPTAFSVLIGALTMTQARELQTDLPDPLPPEAGPSSPPVAAPPTVKRSPRRVVIGTAILLGAALGLSIWSLSDEALTPDAAIDRQWLERAVEIRLDDDGQPLSVVSHDAGLVLVGYCMAGTSESRCTPLHLVPGAETGRRLGVFSRPDRSGSRFAIEIRRNPGEFDWVAGDGLQPIGALSAPQLPEGSATIPVRR
jgi:hypothetical protein